MNYVKTLCGAAIVMLAASRITAEDRYPKIFFQKGVNFTAEFPGGYGSESSLEMLRALPKHGVNSIAIVPYGFTPQNSGIVRFGGGMERDEGIEKISTLAHQLKLKVLLKPQIWVQRGFPGDLEFQ